MAQAVTAMIPLQVLTPPRPLEELSDRIGKLAPAALLDSLELRARSASWRRALSMVCARLLAEVGSVLGHPAPTRQPARGDVAARGTSVLIYDSELVMRGDELPHPVNYSLLRIIPPDRAEIDDRKRPISS